MYTPQYVTTPQGINAELTKVSLAISKCLQREQSTGNSMNVPLDMNSNRVLNLPAATDPTDPMRREDTIQYLDTVYLQKLITQYGLGTSGGGTGSVVAPTDHAILNNRDQADQHPISSITNLQGSLNNKAGVVHSHVVSDVTGLQSALDAKQATLVSGSTIKTVNGNSLLGSGDLVIAGGGSGTTDHSALTNRGTADQHPVSAITGLQVALDSKQAADADLTAIAALSTNGVPRRTGTNTWSMLVDLKEIVVSTTAPTDTTKLWLDIT